MTWQPTTLGVISGIVTVIGFMCVVPMLPNGSITGSRTILGRIDWALTAGLIVTYAVTCRTGGPTTRVAPSRGLLFQDLSKWQIVCLMEHLSSNLVIHH